MRVLILSGLSMALLSACGQKSDRDVLTEACIAEGEGPQTCACITQAMEDSLSPRLFQRTAAAVGREQRDVEDFVESLSMGEKLEFASALTAMVSCDLTEQVDQ
ncbi:hypothetical protein [Hyphomonas sp.]|jgi:hypothetical protein|uniref:hypothetical protein n=1 Tax=Hyphomonas sp. TaxID=87 RepID=UPI0025BA33FB|nr:hypothetical protein [Hyphomonas sp.]MEE2922866.1 hypothetical protein [Pseudomonadota bacterium]